MNEFTVPSAFIQKVEVSGGYLIKLDKEDGAKGWVLVIELMASDRKRGDLSPLPQAEFFFPTREIAMQCGESFSPIETADGFIALPGQVALIQNYYRC